ncbi:MAG: twin-arginine translocation signal domain-containing protein, partial [Gemmobacter sp.]
MKSQFGRFNRRTFLKTSAAGMGALATPAIISSKALASSGEI